MNVRMIEFSTDEQSTKILIYSFITIETANSEINH